MTDLKKTLLIIHPWNYGSYATSGWLYFVEEQNFNCISKYYKESIILADSNSGIIPGNRESHFWFSNVFSGSISEFGLDLPWRRISTIVLPRFFFNSNFTPILSMEIWICTFNTQDLKENSVKFQCCDLTFFQCVRLAVR